LKKKKEKLKKLPFGNFILFFGSFFLGNVGMGGRPHLFLFLFLFVIKFLSFATILFREKKIVGVTA